jgi:hypothetical protein
VAQPQAEHARRVVGYYRTPESRLAHRLLLGGTEHVGHYPEEAGRLSMATAMRRMEDRLGETLALYLARRRRIRYAIRYPALHVLAGIVERKRRGRCSGTRSRPGPR